MDEVCARVRVLREFWDRVGSADVDEVAGCRSAEGCRVACLRCLIQAASFGEHVDDLKPIIQNGSSDSSALDAVFEVLGHAGRDLPTTRPVSDSKRP